MFAAFVKNLVFPAGKLPNTFPWSVGTAGRKYFGALGQFIIGSVLAPAVVVAVSFFLATYPAMQSYLSDPVQSVRFLGGTGLAVASLSFLLGTLRRYRKGSKISLGGLVARLPIHMLIGAAAAALLALAIVKFEPYYFGAMSWFCGKMADKNGGADVTFVMWLSLMSFVMGFGMQVRYIARELRKEGLSLAQAMSLTIEPLKGKNWVWTTFNIVLPVAIAYGVSQLLGETIIYLMGPAHQPTVDLAKQATGGNMWLFALMAAVGAPIFEEIVFRGFMFNVIRCSLLREAQPYVARTVPASGIWHYVMGAWNALARPLYSVRAYMHTVLGGKRAEFTAVIISSLVFSLMHMQFQPTTMVLLFMMGCIQAEVYRRTGSLYCAMLLHAVNNGLEVLKLIIG